MAATSPYSNNDLSVMNYRGYHLPINEVFKAISAQNKFWVEGAQKVKSQYEDALNLNLTLKQNSDIRDQFMKDSEKQLTKLSTMNLADPSVQRQGFSIFKPLFKDRAISQDDFLTKRRASIFSDAENYKNNEKDKGAGYHMDNLAYALRAFKGFGRDTDRNQLESIYNKAKDAEYIPYYDVSKERLDILNKYCKPNKVSNTTTQGMYLETERAASLTSQKLWGCLESGMSDKARQQIRISGAVRYNDDYQTLKNDYISASEDKMKYYKEQMKDAATKKAIYAGKKGYEEYVSQLDEQIQMYKDGISKHENDLTSYKNWDDKYMQDNYEDLAFMAYFKRANGAFAESFAYTDIEKDKKADPIELAYYTQSQLNQRQDKELLHDTLMEDQRTRNDILIERVKAELKGDEDDKKAGDIPSQIRKMKEKGYTDDQIYTYFGRAVEKEGLNESVINNAISTRDNAVKSVRSEIVAEINRIPSLDAVVDGDMTNESQFKLAIPKIYEFIQGRLKLDPNDPDATRLKSGIDRYLQTVNERTQYQSILNEAHRKISKNNPEIAKNYEKVIAELPQVVKLTNTTTVSKSDLISIFSGDHPNYIVKYDEQKYRNQPPSSRHYRLYDKNTGQELGIVSDGSTYEKMFGKFVMGTATKNENYREKLNKYLGENTVVQKMNISTGNLLGKGELNDKEPNQYMQFIQEIFGNKLGANTKFSTVGSFDPVEGWIELQASEGPEGKPISGKRLREAIGANGFLGNSSYDKTDKSHNSVRIKMPQLAGVVNEPEYATTLRELMFSAKNIVEKENVPTGVIYDAGTTPSGKLVQLKAMKQIGSPTAAYIVLLDGKVALPENSQQEYVLSYINSLLKDRANTTIK